MNVTQASIRIVNCPLALALALGLCVAPAYAAKYTYHGDLMDGDAPAEGAYDLRVRAFAQPGATKALAEPTELPGVKISAGGFSVELDLPGQMEQELVGYSVLENSLYLRRGLVPSWSRPTLVIRDEKILSPLEAAPIVPGDYIYLLAPPEKAAALDRFFVNMPPPAALQTWARRHGTSAWAVALAIRARGTKGHRYLQRAVDANRERIFRLFDEAVGRMVR